MKNVLLKIYGIIIILICLTPVVLIMGDSKEVCAYTSSTIALTDDMIKVSSEIVDNVKSNMLDDSYGTKWICDSISETYEDCGDYTYYYMNNWLVIDMGEPYIIHEYDLCPYFAGNYCGATDFEFAGSNEDGAEGSDDNDWVTLDTVIGNASPFAARWDTNTENDAFDYSTNTADSANTAAFRYYRIKITKTCDAYSAEICDIYMYGEKPVTLSFNSNGGSIQSGYSESRTNFLIKY